ncbi:hypothetical protein SODALDRAFT_24293 [Sodiomyces alkalinus F11]|uniref:Uncharacterized protein n=1 Tax=Sodiomyces alkalinus (strain CBS 110278 / VKM F-3762 / F11) TaxID=1314773 RepID=A0A3N2Q7Z9_SODAK|nr:hypothetical protein SODALDRAFT_24293 [Sodiomyces alkalinus F11]ROT42807.1 hypothetical protein SODALDRAFT_24293 [Sodiomyces alkalinus F11]
MICTKQATREQCTNSSGKRGPIGVCENNPKRLEGFKGGKKRRRKIGGRERERESGRGKEEEEEE